MQLIEIDIEGNRWQLDRFMCQFFLSIFIDCIGKEVTVGASSSEEYG